MKPMTFIFNFMQLLGWLKKATSVPLNTLWCSKNHNMSLITIFRTATVHDKYWHEKAGIISSHFSAGVFYSDLKEEKASRTTFIYFHTICFTWASSSIDQQYKTALPKISRRAIFQVKHQILSLLSFFF